MKRKIIQIDEEKCNGCGQCASACHEGAIQMVDGKAKLVADVYCDGLGACIGECPVDAIRIIEREADDFDEVAVAQRLKKLGRPPAAPAGHAPHSHPHPHAGGGCPGSRVQDFRPQPTRQPDLPCGCPGSAMRDLRGSEEDDALDAPSAAPALSRLGQWPVQLRLVPPHAPFLEGADLVICADCVPFAVPDFHERYLKGRAVVVACPKLDPGEDNLERLEALAQNANVRSLTVLRMEVPCCGGLAHQAVQAFRTHAPQVPIEVHVVGIRGAITVVRG